MFLLRLLTWFAAQRNEAVGGAAQDQRNLGNRAMRAWSIASMIGRMTRYHDERGHE